MKKFTKFLSKNINQDKKNVKQLKSVLSTRLHGREKRIAKEKLISAKCNLHDDKEQLIGIKENFR